MLSMRSKIAWAVIGSAGAAGSSYILLFGKSAQGIDAEDKK
jgi:hypothetical protein